MTNKDFHKAMLDVFNEQSVNIAVYVSRGVAKTENYDPMRDTGKQVLLQNSFNVKALVKQVSGYSKTLQMTGFSESDVLDLIIKKSFKNMLLISRKIEINGVEYYAAYDAQGKKFTITDLPLGFTKIRVFRKQK